MTGDGLNEVTNPSEIFLASHSTETIGSAIVATFEGSRPILVEVQALTTFAHYGPPRRIANGIDMGRLLMIAAVLTRRARINLSNQDIITNVVGGLKVSEPVADLGIALAIASSFKDSKVAPDIIALGEIGLSGELRHVPQLERRLNEAARLGFKRYIVPSSVHLSKGHDDAIQVMRAKSVAEAIQMGLTAQKSGDADD
jgi:DNA repair protein RadA/Sms